MTYTVITFLKREHCKLSAVGYAIVVAGLIFTFCCHGYLPVIQVLDPSKTKLDKTLTRIRIIPLNGKSPPNRDRSKYYRQRKAGTDL